jgi:hypothetical protein
MWHTSFTDFFLKLRRHTAIWKHLLFASDRNRVRGAVLGLSQDGACANLFENFREHRLKQDLSNDTTINLPLFSLVNTFKLYLFVNRLGAVQFEKIFLTFTQISPKNILT